MKIITAHYPMFLGIVLLVASSMLSMEVAAAWGWGATSEEGAALLVVPPTIVNNNTIESIIHSEKRYVLLYNSRRLSGECLPICMDTTRPPTLQATLPPVTDGAQTLAPTDPVTFPPSALDDTNTPTSSDSTLPPVADGATSDCACDAGDDHAGSFKCGNDLYVCPGVENICATQGSQNTAFYYLDEEQCKQMQAIKLEAKCLALPAQGLDKPKGLSNRVCYDGTNGRFGTKVDSGSCDECQEFMRVPPAAPPVPPTNAPTQFIDPGSFCHALGVKNGCDLSGPGSCQINPGPNNEPSCGWGVPAGYYPDLNNCNAYCKCTGTTAPSRYEIVNTGLEWDNFQQEGSNYYLPGQMGKNGAWGTNGGGAGRPSDMSVEGRLRPGGPNGKTCGPKQTCPSGSYKSQPWDNCTKWYTCNNGKSGPVQKCPDGLLFRVDLGICDWAANVKCN
jgi:hypothetical protein